MLIPKTLLSPLEMKGDVKSEKFRRNQLKYSRMVREIQNHHKCSFFEARDMFFEYRDNRKPIRVSIYF